LETLQNFVEKIKNAQSLPEAEKMFNEIRSNGHADNGAASRRAAKTTTHQGK
jgi:hypothetical protein